MAETSTPPSSSADGAGTASASPSSPKSRPVRKPAAPKSEAKAVTTPNRRRARRTTGKTSRTVPPKQTSAAASGAIAATLDKVEMAVPVAAVAKPIKAVARGVKRRSTAAARPVADAATPITTEITRRARSAASAVRQTATNARQRVEAGAAAVSRSAGDAYDATKKRAGRATEATKSAAKSRTAVVIGAAAAGLVTGLAVNLGRKVAVQAPSVMAGDWFEAIKLEHKMALTLFDAIEGTTDAEPAKRMMLLIQLTHALSKHAFTEENVIYPALRDWGDKADADKLTHDHGYVKQHLYDLDSIDPASAAFLPKIATFRADLEAHIAEEEQSIFPPLHAGLDEAQNGKITALANKEGFKLA